MKIEQNTLKEYYANLLKMQENGYIFRNFENLKPLFPKAAKKQNSDFLCAIKISPLLIRNTKLQKNDFILVAPALGSGKIQHACSDNLNKLKGIGMKIIVDNLYENSHQIYYYNMPCKANMSETDTEFIKNRQNALLFIRLFEKYKENMLLENSQNEILVTINSKEKLKIETRNKNLFGISVKMQLIEKEEKFTKYSELAKENNKNKIFSDSYLLVFFAI